MRDLIKLIMPAGKKSSLIVGIVSGLVALLNVLQTEAWARGRSKINLKSTKAQSGEYIDRVATPSAEKSLQAEIFDGRITSELSGRFNSYQQDYEYKEKYHLNRIEDQQKYNDYNRDLMRWALKKMMHYHGQKQIQSAFKKAQQGSSVVKSVGNTVQSAQKAVAAIQNSSVSLSESAKGSFKYDFPTGRATVGLTSSVVHASFQYRMKAFLGNFDPSNIQRIGTPAAAASQDSEKLVFNMSRNFDEIGLSTGMNYGIKERTLNYGVNQKVIGPVSAQVDQARSLKNSSRDETVYRVNVGTSF